MRKAIKRYIERRPVATTTLFLLMSLSLTNHAFAAAKRIKVFEPKSRQLAPKLRLKDLAGNTYRLSEDTGQLRVVNFWSSWCVPCIREMPSLDGLQQQLGRPSLSVVAVAVGDSLQEVRQFSHRTPVDFPLLPDSEQLTSDAWDVVALPTSYIIDRQGYIAVQIVGDYDWQSDEIATLLHSLNQPASTAGADAAAVAP